jgi:hypothetical protein
MKLLLLSVLVLAFSCGPASNSKGRGNNPNPDRPQVNPDDNDQGIDKLSTYQRSQAFRTRGSKQLSYSSEREVKADGDIPASLHLIPNILTDFDATVTKATLPPQDCGVFTEAATIKQRMVDCKSKNPSTFKWIGKNNGIAGEVDWQLVMKMGSTILWQDLSTGLIWSDQLKNTEEWRLASGADGNAERMACQAATDVMALGNIPKEEIHWRLPTRNDFLLADINGARYVLPNTDATYWSASLSDKDNAWAIEQSTGILEKHSLGNKHLVRCVGTALK